MRPIGGLWTGERCPDCNAPATAMVGEERMERRWRMTRDEDFKPYAEPYLQAHRCTALKGLVVESHNRPWGRGE